MSGSPIQINFATRLSRVAIVAAVFVLAACANRAQAQILQYLFNETGTTATNTGSLTGANLNFQNVSGTATDLHSVAGGGVSGSAGDRSFDNTSATGMGNAGAGGIGINTTANPFNGLTSFTISGWYRASSAPFGTGARLLISNDQKLSLNFNSANLTLSVTNSAAGVGTINTANATANTANSWVFFAATYDGTNLRLYLGTPTATAGSVSTVAYTGTISTAAGLEVGNVPTAGFNRPFQGLMDDFRLYGSTVDTTGALSLAQIQGVQAGDLSAVPEPTSLAATAVFAVAGGWLLRRRRKVC